MTRLYSKTKIFRFLSGSQIGRQLIRKGFLLIAGHLPYKKIIQTENLLAFEHPQPSYPLHIILMPTREIPTLQDVLPNDTPFFQELISAVASIIKQKNLGTFGYRLICNGGPHQQFPMLHFHLISDNYTPDENQEG